MLTPQFLLPIHSELVIDLFAGGGGASTGIEQAIGRAVDSARVEVEYIKVTSQDTSNFIDGLKAPEAVAAITNGPNGTIIDRSLPGVVRHTLGE